MGACNPKVASINPSIRQNEWSSQFWIQKARVSETYFRDLALKEIIGVPNRGTSANTMIALYLKTGGLNWICCSVTHYMA